MLHTREIACPYCGESFSTSIDVSGSDAGAELHYIEDCYVCCRPVVFAVYLDDRRELLHVSVARDDE